MTSKDEIASEHHWFRRACLISLFHLEHIAMRKSFKRQARWRISDTAFELNISVGAVSEALTVAKNASKLDLNECKSMNEAMEKYRREK